ncbi:metal-sulfur cluster assembly factor [Brevibacillus borstelensis]|uniref:metal-sulfur cluster assembly factor n=1 Tax=Brevibacillus borstelensis TaxID=45462 RepID=UPI0030C0AFB5
MDITEKLWAALEDVIDPEVGVNIVDLGLVYDIAVDEEKNVTITMTLTIPECPLRDMIVSQVEAKAKSIPEVGKVHVNLVFEPAWSPARMNDRAREEIRNRRTLV